MGATRLALVALQEEERPELHSCSVSLCDALYHIMIQHEALTRCRADADVKLLDSQPPEPQIKTKFLFFINYLIWGILL
jgi:hypothetical protein